MTTQLEQIWSQLLNFSTQYVVPDWGSLVGLIPILLAILMFLFITWTIYRFATAGPKRRGKRRLEPVPPPGVHMPGGSFAPLLAAFGCFMLVFGLVTGGFWLWIGFAILAVTLLYWGREALRDYDHIPSASTALVTTGGTGLTTGGTLPPGPLPAPEGSPPAGVHMPGPSFRPLLVAMSMTLLVAGLVVGGWALIFGFIALTVTLLEWLRDARHEYALTERADRTGHLDNGPRAELAHGDVRDPRAAARGRPPDDVRPAPQLRHARGERRPGARAGGAAGGGGAPRRPPRACPPPTSTSPRRARRSSRRP